MKSIAFFLILLPCCALAQLKVDKPYFDNLLAAGKYEQVFLECNNLLKAPYGKTNGLLYYYIGRSLCAKGYTSQGKAWYQYLKDKLPIEKSFYEEINQAEAGCNNSTTARTPNTVNIIINASYTPSQPGGVRGKGGFTLGCDKDVNENYDALRKNDSLGKRVFTVDQKAKAIAYLRNMLPFGYSIDSAGRFLVVSRSTGQYGHDKVKQVADKLEAAYHFFMDQYQLAGSNKLFTVYLAESRYTLRNIAKDVHHITLSEANIGYSSLNDLSLLGIADPGSVGTLFHELFHLVIRSDIGDISPWLDEGMACLYSVYKTTQGGIEGNYNTWRSMHFKLLMNLKSVDRVTVPSLEQLISYNWMDYQGGHDNNLCLASVNYALSNFFTLYLQQLKQLTNVVTAFKNRRTLGTDSLLPGPADSSLLEMVLHKKTPAIAADFYHWVEMQYSIDLPLLLEERPAIAMSELPLDIQALADSSYMLLQQVSALSSLKSSELKKLKKDQEEILAEAKSKQHNIINRQNQWLQDLAESNMSNDFSAYIAQRQDPDENNSRLKLRDFIARLNQLLKPQ